jgi:hypothetical protein
MADEQLVAELFDLAEMTRDLARKIGDPAISRELEEVADRVDELAHAEARSLAAICNSSVRRLS